MAVVSNTSGQMSAAILVDGVAVDQPWFAVCSSQR